MLSHDLAKILLDNPNLPIATHANNHTYSSGRDNRAFPLCNVGIYAECSGEHIIIGNISKRNINGVNGHITSMISGDVPEEWVRVI